MPRKEIVIVRNSEDPDFYIDYKDEILLAEGDKTEDSIPLKLLADFCDQYAESRNNHDFCGTHRLLAVILLKHVGEDKATSIMREIAEYGGLDGISGVQHASAFKDFGIKGCWSDWDLPATVEE
jgi:hypothetical protein